MMNSADQGGPPVIHRGPRADGRGPMAEGRGG